MKHSVNALLAVISWYYPRGLYPDDPGYHDTEEHRRLVQARIQAAAEGSPWDALLERLRVRFPKALVNRSLGLVTGNYDGAYLGSIKLPSRGWYERHHELNLMISFLVPYYVVYSAANVLAPVTDGGQVNRYVSFIFTPDEAPHVHALVEEILAVFPDYERMPPEIGNIPLPDYIESFHEGTIYKALFTSTL
jgi:hypothetical protein